LAGLGRKEFNSGDILLASEVQGYLQDQAVMVFDDAAARGSAIPTPSEGMLTYNKDTDALELYDGSAFGPVGSDAGLIHINTTSFSAVASQSVNDVFTSNFDSYKILINCTPTTTNPNTEDMRLRLRVSGTDSTVSYDSAFFFRIDGSFGSTKAGFNGAYIGGMGNRRFGSEVNVYNPEKVSFTALFANTSTSGDANQMAVSSGTIHVVSASYTGFTLVCSSGTMTGSVTTYGLKL
jgi:hypothetical protein